MRKILEYVEEKESVSKVEGIGWVSLLYSTVGLKIKIILSGNHFPAVNEHFLVLKL